MTQETALKEIMFPSEGRVGKKTGAKSKRSREAAAVRDLLNAGVYLGDVGLSWLGQTGPSRSREMNHVGSQGFPEVSRQMGMEMSRQ